MTGKSGIQFSGALALLALLGTHGAEAGLKQLEIKGKTSLAGYTLNKNNGNAIRGGGSDSTLLLDTDLDFKMKFSQDVSARIDLELDGGQAGEQIFDGKSTSNVSTQDNRFAIGVDQAFFKMNDFLFKNFALSLGKQDLNMSLRDRGSYNWAWGDPVSMVGSYSTRDMDLKLYFAKYNDDSNLATSGSTNNDDDELYGTYGEYWLNDDSLVIGYVNYKSVDTAASVNRNILHYGLGLDYFVGETLELYAEVAGQSLSSKTTAYDGSAYQLNLGVEYAFADFDMKPTVNVDYYLQSGADSSDPAWQNIGGGSAGAENQSLFVEGLGRDAATRDLNFGAGLVSFAGGTSATNGGYSVLRLNSWISPSKSTKVGLGAHFFKDEDNTSSDDLGTEVDLTGSWKYSQDVTFRAGTFIWLGGNTDGTTASAAGTQYEDVTGFTVSSSLMF